LRGGCGGRLRVAVGVRADSDKKRLAPTASACKHAGREAERSVADARWPR